MFIQNRTGNKSEPSLLFLLLGVFVVRCVAGFDAVSRFAVKHAIRLVDSKAPHHHIAIGDKMCCPLLVCFAPTIMKVLSTLKKMSDDIVESADQSIEQWPSLPINQAMLVVQQGKDLANARARFSVSATNGDLLKSFDLLEKCFDTCAQRLDLKADHILNCCYNKFKKAYQRVSEVACSAPLNDWLSTYYVGPTLLNSLREEIPSNQTLADFNCSYKNALACFGDINGVRLERGMVEDVALAKERDTVRVWFDTLTILQLLAHECGEAERNEMALAIFKALKSRLVGIPAGVRRALEKLIPAKILAEYKALLLAKAKTPRPSIAKAAAKAIVVPDSSST